LDGYNGTISRNCIQDGPMGNWSSIIGSCDGISLIIQLFFFENNLNLNLNVK